MTADLMRPIIADPADDGPRLVYADWLDENGEPERAEFIRVQIELARHPNHKYLPDWHDGRKSQDCWHDCARCRLERAENSLLEYVKTWFPDIVDLIIAGADLRWHISRGFPSSIACTMSAFMGGECEHERCNHGQIYVGHDNMKWYPCPDCTDGRVPGLVDTVFSRWPIVDVRLTDMGPWYERGYGGEYCWWRESVWSSPINDRTGNITDELFDKIAELHPDNRLSWGGPPHNQHIGFDTRDAALTALSHAATDLGRERAGLPAIRRHGHSVKRQAVNSQQGV